MEQWEGTLDKITYYNEDSSYLVGRLLCNDGEKITIVGNLPPLQEGESLLVKGEWRIHNRYGRQVEVKSWERLLPATEEGLKRYLGSGLIKGIGPATAGKIVGRFGLSTLAVMDKEPHRLLEIEGIGEKKAASIEKSFRSYKEVQDVLVSLQGYGIGANQALRLYRQYGSQTVRKVKENPYRLAEEVLGIGFKTADKISRLLGLPEDSPERVSAAITFALRQASDQGHVYLPREELLEKVQELLSLPEEEGAAPDILDQLNELVRTRRVLIDEEVYGGGAYYAPFYYAEQGVARRLMTLARTTHAGKKEEARQAFKTAAGGGILTDEQRLVLETALQSGVLVVTGGPGTGKTTTIKALLVLFEKLKRTVLLAAPTGRAAKRVTEATGREAFTIHRLLEYCHIEGEGFRFQRNEDRPVEGEVIIVDEASMVDLMLMYQLLKAVPDGCRLILVGDVDQLPAVGAGNVLSDLIESGCLPCVRLQHIFRQARESMIIVNAHRINRGEMPHLNVKEKDFFFIQEEDPEKAARLIVKLCRERIPNYGPFDPLKDMQVLTPMRRTPAGVEKLNDLMQNQLNPAGRHKPETSYKGFTYRLGDKVMQVRNNYQKEVYNGDIGLISSLDPEEGELVVSFREGSATRPVAYDFSELDELTLSYAVSVHKSQGSEYPVIVMPVLTQHYLLLQRNLLYTGITRARSLAVLVGTRKALAIAVRNNKAEERYSFLGGRLRREEKLPHGPPPSPA